MAAVFIVAWLLEVVAFPPCGSQAKHDESFRYEPGILERQWVDQKVQGSVCRIAREQMRARGAPLGKWLNYSANVVGVRNRLPTPSEASSLSSLQCTDGRREYLEPLTGIARHPHAHVGCHRLLGRDPHFKEVDPFNISYLVLQNACPVTSKPSKASPSPPSTSSSSGIGQRLDPNAKHGVRKRRNILFDLGASHYKGAFTLDGGFGLGPSVPLFHALYERNCIVFDQIYAWEYEVFQPQVYWDSVPAHMRSKLHFFNVPVEQEPTANPGHSVINVLKASVRADDFVVMKVDVDNAAVEQSVVQTIATDPTVAALIDELFFEHHFFYEPGHTIWGKPMRPDLPETNSTDTVDDALNLMTRLRKRGVRAHFWI